jgi:hypothetical protein
LRADTTLAAGLARAPAQDSLTMAITIDASRQAQMITSITTQLLGMARS